MIRSINISILISQDTGIVQHYYKPKEDELIKDYLNVIEFLTKDTDSINLNRQIQDIGTKNKNIEFLIQIIL